MQLKTNYGIFNGCPESRVRVPLSTLYSIVSVSFGIQNYIMEALLYCRVFILCGFYIFFSYYNVYLLFFTVDICCQTNFVRKNRFCHQLCHMVYLLKKVLLFKPFKGTVSHDFYPFYEKALPGPQMIRIKRFCEILLCAKIL